MKKEDSTFHTDGPLVEEETIERKTIIRPMTPPLLTLNELIITDKVAWQNIPSVLTKAINHVIDN